MATVPELEAALTTVHLYCDTLKKQIKADGEYEVSLIARVTAMEDELRKLRAERLHAMAEEKSDPPNPVQQRVDAVVDDLAKGLTSKPQEEALRRGLENRKVNRAFGR